MKNVSLEKLLFVLVMGLLFFCGSQLHLFSQETSSGSDTDFDTMMEDFMKDLEAELDSDLKSHKGRTLEYDIKQQLKSSDGDTVYGYGTEYYDQPKAEEIRTEDWRFYGITQDGLLSDRELKLVIEEVSQKVGKEEAVRELRILTQSAGRENLRAWWDKISDCKGFCSRVVQKIFTLHMIRVSKSDHWILIFDTGKNSVKSVYHSPLRSISDIVRNNPDSSILLIGRASHIGSLLYNRVLSEKRVVSVKRKLVEYGIPERKITSYHFGYEPPQITNHVRELYKLDDYNVGLGVTVDKNLQYINQSVLVVIRK